MPPATRPRLRRPGELCMLVSCGGSAHPALKLDRSGRRPAHRTGAVAQARCSPGGVRRRRAAPSTRDVLGRPGRQAPSAWSVCLLLGRLGEPMRPGASQRIRTRLVVRRVHVLLAVRTPWPGARRMLARSTDDDGMEGEPAAGATMSARDNRHRVRTLGHRLQVRARQPLSASGRHRIPAGHPLAARADTARARTLGIDSACDPSPASTATLAPLVAVSQSTFGAHALSTIARKPLMSTRTPRPRGSPGSLDPSWGLELLSEAPRLCTGDPKTFGLLVAVVCERGGGQTHPGD
jgi:hypothetical protein